ncbi:MAG: hypothetical protein AAFQ57_10485 [Cyanobacteria bacterium J06626_14]
MTMSPFSQEIKELAAGYVLGDLTSDEAELFQSLLAELPELHKEVADLQEALAIMPYGLPDTEISDEVRSHLMAKTEAELSIELPTEPISLNSPKIHDLESTQQPTLSRSRQWLPWLVSSVAAGLAIVCGVATLRLSSQVRFLQAQSELTADQVSIVHTWLGLQDILQDHQRSLSNPNGPVDFVVGRPSDILDLLSDLQTTQAALPLLPQGKLLGGSNCQIGKAQGLRLTYQLSANQTVSAYQLSITNTDVPELSSAQVTLQRPDGMSMVLWRDDNYVYALVASLPIPELQTLAHSIDST